MKFFDILNNQSGAKVGELVQFSMGLVAIVWLKPMDAGPDTSFNREWVVSLDKAREIYEELGSFLIVVKGDA